MMYVKYLGALAAFIQLAGARPLEKHEDVSTSKAINPGLEQIMKEYAGLGLDRVAGSATVAGNKTFFTEYYGAVWGKDSNQIGVKIINPNGIQQNFIDGLLEYCDASALGCQKYVCHGLCDIEKLAAIADLLPEGVGQIDHIPGPTGSSFSGSGSISTQATVAMQVNRLKEKYPELTGKGIKIGIIANSFDLGKERNRTATTMQDDIASGDIPADVTILRESSFDIDSFFFNDEGRATAQVIHDIVPDAKLFFYTGFLPGLFAESIKALVAEGCDVIVDDVRSDGLEPIFQMGPTGKAANDAAEENGVAYFTVARNLGTNSWESRGYKKTKCPDIDEFEEYESCFDFGDGNPFQSLRVRGPGRVALYWSDPWTSISGPPGPQTDLDLFLFDAPNIYRPSKNRNNELGDAVEWIPVTRPDHQIVIAKRSGPDPDYIKWVCRTAVSSNPPANSATLTGTGQAPSIVAVGAAFEKQVFGQLAKQSFTSLGGIPFLFDESGNRLEQELVLKQPRLVGPDGSYTTFFDKTAPVYGLDPGQSESTPPRFIGTSCAAPNVAAVAALLIQAISDKEGDRRQLKKGRNKKKKGKTSKKEKKDLELPFSVYQALEDTAIDMDEPGYDFFTGYGFVNALAAVEKIVEGGGSDVLFEDFLFPVLAFF